MPLTPRTEKPGPEVSRQSLVLSWGGLSFFSCSCVGWGVVVVYQPASGKSIWGTGDLTRRHWFLGPAICSRGLFILPGGRAEGALSSGPSCWTQLTSCLQQGEVVGGECGLEVMSIRPWGQVTWVPIAALFPLGGLCDVFCQVTAGLSRRVTPRGFSGGPGDTVDGVNPSGLFPWFGCS